MRTDTKVFKRTRGLLFALLLLSFWHKALAESAATVALPKFGDTYSKLVSQLESGETNIDYRELRNSFLESEQLKAATSQKPDLDALRKSLHELMKEEKYTDIAGVAKKMLSIDYTDMEAHKVLQQTYKALGDAPNQKKYRDIEFGLLNSIVKNGDGKTCATAWPVIQIREEYFILEMLGAKGGQCDRMEVQTNEGEKTYYFEVSKVFQSYEKQGIH